MSNRPRGRRPHHPRGRILAAVPDPARTKPSEEELDHFTDVVMSVLSGLLRGDPDAAVDQLQTACADPVDGFAAMCAMANIVTTISAIEQGKPIGSSTRTTVVRTDGAPLGASAEEVAASDVAAFIAAVGNRDYDGAWELFDSVCCTDGAHERGGRFMAGVMGVAAAHVGREPS